MTFGLARETGDGSSKGLIASSEPAAFQYEFEDSNGENIRLSFNCDSFTRFPQYAGTCSSNYGDVTITGQSDTPFLPNVPVDVEYNFSEAGFDCTMTDTRTSLGESVAGNFDISCTGAPFGAGSGTYGGVAKVGGSAEEISTDKFISTPTNFYYKTTVTGNDGTVKVIQKTELGAVLFPKNEGSGEDNYLGTYKSVQLTESNASGVTKQKQLYDNGEWAEFAYTTKANGGNSLTFSGDYVDSKGLVGTYVSEVTRDADPITAQYDSMKEEMQQTVNSFDSNGNVVDTSTGTVNLNLGLGNPYGNGTSETYGAFTWTSDSEPAIDYTAGTMSLKTRRNYQGGENGEWFQDYTYDLPFPIGGVNVFVADVTSSANRPSGVPETSRVQVVAEEQGEHAVQSFLSEAGPTKAEALFTNDRGQEYKLKFDNYQRFAGFNNDGSAKVAGTSSSGTSNALGSVSLITGDYSTIADGYYTETMNVAGQTCTVTYRPTGGPAMDESGDYESDCPKLENGSWKSSKGPKASLDKFVEEETRVDDVSTRTCGPKEGTNAKCKDRKITGTMTTVYFPRVEGHGTDNYHGKFKRYALADTALQGENTKIIEYDDGFVTKNVYTLKVNSNTAV